MGKPRLLDLFCGAGGAGMGYARAGFEVVGVDLAPQKHYPFEFHQADAMTFPLDGFDAIHASPPCQDYSNSGAFGRKRRGAFPRLIEPVRERLIVSGLPWVIENVDGAWADMLNSISLCGTSFGLRVQRHRRFLSNALIFGHGVCRHRAGDVSVRTSRREYLGIYSDHVIHTAEGETRYRYQTCSIVDARSAMGIDWPMTGHELGEAIPPAYTEWLGRQLMTVLESEAS